MKNLLIYLVVFLGILAIASCSKEEFTEKEVFFEDRLDAKISKEALPETVSSVVFLEKKDSRVALAIDYFGLGNSDEISAIELWNYKNGLQVIAFSDRNIKDIRNSDNQGNVYHYVLSKNYGFVNEIVIGVNSTLITENIEGAKPDWAACFLFGLAVLTPEPGGLLDLYFGIKCVQSF